MNGEEARAFEQVVEIAQDQARATAALVEIERQNTTKLDAIIALAGGTSVALAAVSNALAHMDKMRDVAVGEVKTHTELKIASADRSGRMLIWLIGALVAVSQIISALILGWIVRSGR